jgi:nickel/cobalt exporter
MLKINSKSASFVLKIAGLLLTMLILILPADSAHADPPDMYAQNQAITIQPDGLHVDWKIAPGPVIADATWQAADLNHDGSISQQEANTWTKPFIAGYSINTDGNPVNLIQVENIRWPASVDSLRTGQDAIEIQLLVKWPNGLTGKHSIQINNSYLESNSLNWFSLTGEGGFSFDQPNQNNNLLSFELYFPASPNASTPIASSMTSWNSGIPNLPGFTGTISNLAINLAAPSSPTQSQSQTQAPAAPTSATPFTAALVGLVKTPQLSPLFLMGAFLLSLALGSLHALTPGHGKTLVGAYLVGSHGKIQDAVFLGAVVTVTHTGSVLLLGLLTLLASHFILPSLVTPWLEILSGLLVIGFGINLLLQRRRDLISWSNKKSAENKAGLSIQSAKVIEPHSHGLFHSHSHSHDGHTHEHTHGESDHEHSHALADHRLTWKSLLALGVSGGLVPCPDAIAILLVAVAINRIPLGMMMIVAFSIGLALVLIAIGVAMVQGMRFVTRSEFLNRFSIYTPIISAVVVLGLGLALTINAVGSLRFAATVLAAPASSPVANAESKTSNAAPISAIQPMRLLYIASDNQGRDQLFATRLSGGAAIQYTQEPSGIVSYSLSPDHQTILYTVFESDNSTSIWAINSDGSQNRLVLKCPQTECGSLQWYPDSQRVVYERLEDAQNSALARFSIWWLNVSTGDTQPVFRDQTFPGIAAKFSPDGQWLSYISPATNTLTLYRLKDGHTISLPLNSQQMIPESWSPASDSLIFGAPASSQDGAPIHVQRYVLDSGTTIDLGGNGASDYSASWSPDGNWIAVDRDVPSSDGSAPPGNQVWLVKADGSDAHALLTEPGASYSDITWSPDGKSIIYSRYSLQNTANSIGQFDIYQTDIQTGGSTKLVSGGDYPTLLP